MNRWIFIFARSRWKGAEIKQDLPLQDRSACIIITREAQIAGLHANEMFYILEDEDIVREQKWIGEQIEAHAAFGGCRPYLWPKDRRGRTGTK